MEKDLERLQTGLLDAGCSECEVVEAMCLMKAGYPNDLIRHLRRCRCTLVEQMHESQRRVDRLDYLIRNLERTE